MIEMCDAGDLALRQPGLHTTMAVNPNEDTEL
jgi:hypothetical protein